MYIYIYIYGDLELIPMSVKILMVCSYADPALPP